MNEYYRALFELNGGWGALIVQLILEAVKYTAIGLFLHLGWGLL
jgi:hypothetical protein